MGKSMAFHLGFWIIFILPCTTVVFEVGTIWDHQNSEVGKLPLLIFPQMGSDFPETLIGASHKKNQSKRKKRFQCQLNLGHFQKMKCTAQFPIKVGQFQEGSFPHLRSCNVLFSYSFPFPGVLHSTGDLLSCANLKLLQWKTKRSQFPLLSTNNDQSLRHASLLQHSYQPSPLAPVIPFQPVMYTPVIHLTILTCVTVQSHPLVQFLLI